MKGLVRGATALLLAATTTLAAQEPAVAQATLATERDKVSYMVGMDVGASIALVGPDMDLVAFERALAHAFGGGEPLLDEVAAEAVGQALMQRIGVRQGKAPPGTQAPEVDKSQVGLMIGTDVGRSLASIQDEIDMQVFMHGLRVMLAGGTPLLAEAEHAAVKQAFMQRLNAEARAEAAVMATKNKAAGAAFLAGNKTVKGVFSTGSGLQYMVLRQGAGVRPKPGDRVRVNYHGTVLDGRVFDSSYERGQPAEFALDQVIPGWTEGVGLMPVGAKYRFWIPAELAYGERGAPGGVIEPNATLIFDVELLDIL